jgi:uncharacterized protein (UPF0276 family)
VVAAGFTLQPDPEFLELCAPLIRLAEYFEVAPETLWRQGERGQLEPNGYHARFAALGARTGKPFVAHGVGLSMGTSAASDRGRRRRWLERVRADHAVFRFRWYTDHLGASSLGGLAMTLPLPLPMTAAAARTVRARLRAMQSVVPDVGVENNVAYFLLGSPLEEPGFLEACTRAPRTHLLFDLHNLHTMAENLGFDPEAYLERLDLSRVIELHVSGGADSDGAWLPGGRVMRLDSHDAAVPEPVWRLCERVAPRCPNLRGITLERMEGTVFAADVPLLHEELRRTRAIARSCP